MSFIARLSVCLVAVILPLMDVGGQVTPTRGLWVWEATPLLNDLNEQRSFFDFCERKGVGVVGIQIETSKVGPERRLTNASRWKEFLTEASRRRMRLHALDGSPRYALPSEHETVLSIVNAVIAFNASVSSTERFYGIHFDIEPYLLEEWKDPRTRERLLADYLAVNERAAKRARAGGLVYGVDVPFWWKAIDADTGEAVTTTTFHGIRKTAVEHLLDVVDNVGVMAYRNVAAGPDGIITDALDTLNAADAAGDVRAFVGVETEKVRDGVPEKVTFAGKSLEEFHAQINAVDDVFVGRPSYAGIAIHRYATFREMNTR
jgi:hypothetical protein